MGLLSSLKKAAVKVLDTNQAIFSSPITTFTKGIEAGIAETKSKSQKENVVDILKTTAVAAGAVLTAGTSAGRAAVTTIGKALVPTTPKGVITAAIATPVIVGAVTSKPKESIAAPFQAASALTNVGGNIATFIAEPSVSTAKQIITENPLTSSLIGAGVALAAAPIVTPAVSGVLTRESIQDVEGAIRSIPAQPQIIESAAPIVTPSPMMADTATITSNPDFPILPEDKQKSTKRRAYKRKPAQPQVRITNRNINKLVAVLR